MTRGWKLFLTILAVPVAVYVIYKWNYPTISWNQRMTVEVEVNGEVVSGSSVTQVSYEFYPKIITEAGSFARRIQGEAVYVDLGGRPLFALLRGARSSDYMQTLAHDLFRNEVPVSLELSQKLRRMIRGLGLRELSRDDYPMLVTFTDINDPLTVQLVDPRDLAVTFGEGVELERITLEFTGDGVTEGIEDVLGWLSGGRNLDGTSATTSRQLSNALDGGDFRVWRR